MNGFKKVILASAIVAASSSAFALQSLDDDSLSQATGQDGLTISLTPNITRADLFWEDTNGIDTNGSSSEAAALGADATGFTSNATVAITGLSVLASDPVTITLDAGNNGSQNLLAIGVSETGSLTVGLKNIYLGDSTYFTNGAIPAAATGTPLIAFNQGSGANLTISNFTAGVELGNGATHLVTLTGTLSGIQLGSYSSTTTTTTGAYDGTSPISNLGSGLTIYDQSGSGGGAIQLGQVNIDGLALTGTTIDATSAGLVINAGPQNGLTVTVSDIELGNTSSASIGAVKIANIVSPGSTITVTGH